MQSLLPLAKGLDFIPTKGWSIDHTLSFNGCQLLKKMACTLRKSVDRPVWVSTVRCCPEFRGTALWCPASTCTTLSETTLSEHRPIYIGRQHVATFRVLWNGFVVSEIDLYSVERDGCILWTSANWPIWVGVVRRHFEFCETISWGSTLICTVPTMRMLGGRLVQFQGITSYMDGVKCVVSLGTFLIWLTKTNPS